MQKELHPQTNEVKSSCSTCGANFNFVSTVKEIKIDVCSNCHSFYTGKISTGGAAGRIDKFNKKYNKK